MDIAKAREQHEKLRHKPHTMATWGYDWGIPLMDRVEELEEELRLWKPLTPEEAETELAKAEAEPMSDDEINAIVSKVLDPAYSPTNSESAQLAARVKALEQHSDHDCSRDIDCDVCTDRAAAEYLPCGHHVSCEATCVETKTKFCGWCQMEIELEALQPQTPPYVPTVDGTPISDHVKEWLDANEITEEKPVYYGTFPIGFVGHLITRQREAGETILRLSERIKELEAAQAVHPPADEISGEIVVCPMCGKRDDIQGFDVIGACNNNVFCTDCHCEFDPETGHIHECNREAEVASAVSERGETCHGVQQQQSVNRESWPDPNKDGWYVLADSTLRHPCCEDSKLLEVKQHPPADERRIWWPEPDACGWYVWPDANLCPPLYETGHWFARPLSSQEGELFQTKEEAAKWLYDQKCGPYHPQPAPIVRQEPQDEVTE